MRRVRLRRARKGLQRRTQAACSPGPHDSVARVHTPRGQTRENSRLLRHTPRSARNPVTRWPRAFRAITACVSDTRLGRTPKGSGHGASRSCDPRTWTSWLNGIVRGDTVSHFRRGIDAAEKVDTNSPTSVFCIQHTTGPSAVSTSCGRTQSWRCRGLSLRVLPQSRAWSTIPGQLRSALRCDECPDMTTGGDSPWFTGTPIRRESRGLQPGQVTMRSSPATAVREPCWL
jgi:hypothetical protein